MHTPDKEMLYVRTCPYNKLTFEARVQKMVHGTLACNDLPTCTYGRGGA